MSDIASTRRARVYTVPPGQPFLDALAGAILSGEFGTFGDGHPSPLALTDVTLLLPTRRATRALQDAFLRLTGQRALLLPAIRPISEGDDDFTLLAELSGLISGGGDDASAPDVIDPLERQLVLTQLVLRWAERLRAESGDSLDPYEAVGGDTPAQAAQLAAELARLMDTVETEGVSLDRIAHLVPDTFSDHWKKTLEFLGIVTQHWPLYLAAAGKVSPAEQRNRVLLDEARRLREAPPRGPVVVAGVTGSIPATAELMRAVAELPNGAIVLPNLDLSLDEPSWRAIRAGDASSPHPEHPQYGLKLLLERLGLDRADVRMLPGTNLSTDDSERLRFFSEAMRPAATTAHWHTYAGSVDATALRKALAGVNLVDAPTAQDEAEAIALILRHALETPGRTAALVSPDRLLARRVATRLESWGIRVDDSAGRPFPKTVPGAFLDLVVEAAHRRFAPAELMALLKHPLTRVGLGAFEVRRAARALELAAFRTSYFGTGLDGLTAALDAARQDVAAGERRQRAVNRLWDEDWAGAYDLVTRLKAAFAPLSALFDIKQPTTLRALAEAHIAAAEALAAVPPEADTDADDTHAATSPLYAGEAGATAAQLFTGFVNPDLPTLEIAPGDYADLYRSLIIGLNVRPRVPVHPRLSIWGPFEARLQQPDVVILGSLNDGTWPEAADPGAWLNRPMRQALGLPAPEEKIGHAAHDFTSLLGAPQIYLTRAEKIDGVPTVPSRWLMRIVALLDGMQLRDSIAMDKPWLGWARARDVAVSTPRARPPAPTPPVDARPRKLSVSAIEQWIANPYALYAQRILKLDTLPPVGTAPDASLKGSLVHDILATFAGRHPSRLPADTEAALMAIAREKLAPFLPSPRIRAFWLPRFERFARWFAETEPARRAQTTQVHPEISGALVLDAPAGGFTLTARADRIDDTPSGLVITDYKTGQVPTDTKVSEGRAPQLPLEAAIAIGGGFEALGARAVSALRYIRSTGAQPPGEEHLVATPDVAALAREQRDRLAARVARYDDPTTAYRAMRRPGFNYDYDDFAQLARVDEWPDQAGRETAD